MAKKNSDNVTEVTKVEKTVNDLTELAELTELNLFGTEPGENFMLTTLGQTFKQVRDTQVQYKCEDILTELDRRIQIGVRDLRRKSREPQDNLVKLVPNVALASMNLDPLDPIDFCDRMLTWGKEVHNLAKETWIYIILRKSLFGLDWEKPEEVKFVRSKIIV